MALGPVERLKETYMSIRPVSCTIGLLLACVVALAPSQPAQLDVEAFRTKIRKILADKAAPSLAVAVARNGEIVWSEAFGFADREARVPATAETPYSIASLSKPFTATALMILEERGRLGLDAALSRYVGPLERPGVSAPGEVTLRRLLGHVAGFPVHYQY
jgi:CubicO group peptidase (beta-lactamase class C family)